MKTYTFTIFSKPLGGEDGLPMKIGEVDLQGNDYHEAVEPYPSVLETEKSFGVLTGVRSGGVLDHMAV